jgi:hypothetical protein
VQRQPDYQSFVLTRKAVSMTPKTEEDLIYESVCELSYKMARELKDQAMSLYDSMTEDERKKILPERYAAARVLLLAANMIDEKCPLHREFAAESILKNIKSAKRIVRQRR